MNVEPAKPARPRAAGGAMGLRKIWTPGGLSRSSWKRSSRSFRRAIFVVDVNGAVCRLQVVNEMNGTSSNYRSACLIVFAPLADSRCCHTASCKGNGRSDISPMLSGSVIARISSRGGV